MLGVLERYCARGVAFVSYDDAGPTAIRIKNMINIPSIRRTLVLERECKLSRIYLSSRS